MVALSTLISSAVLVASSVQAGFDVKDLQYGPAFRVDHANLKPKNFDDTTLITVGLSGSTHREMNEIKCYTLRGEFVGIESFYQVPGSKDPKTAVYSDYRGWMPVVGWLIKGRSWTLQPDDEWDFISYRWCGRKFTGLHFATKKGGVSCGDYDYTKKAEGCGGDVLRPAGGRKIVGIYGDANGVKWTKAQGVRGIGLITLPVDEK